MSITLLSSDVADSLIEAAEIALNYFEDTRHGREWIESGGVEAAALRDALDKAKEQAGGAS